MIDKSTIDRIFDIADVVDVVSDFITLKKRGVNYIGNCPFHNEKTPSFTVSPAKGIYKCFGCGKGGNSVKFVMDHEQLTYVEALKWVAKKYNIEVIEKELTSEQREQQDARESMLIVSTYAQQVFTNNLLKTEEGSAVGLSYFRERGFTEKTISKFELGYCRKVSDSFSKQALGKGYQEKFLVGTGLSIKGNNQSLFDRFSERVMFPIHNLMGRVIGFGGRTLRTDKKIAKYLNSPESEIYHKSKVLYGIFFAKKAITQNNRCYLVEGYTDVISMHQAGIENVVASSGTALSPDQIRLIKRFTPNITVLFDGDAAGIKAALRGIDMILEEGLNVKVVLLPDGEDPDSYARAHNASGFHDYITENEADFITFKTKLLLGDVEGDPVKKSNLIIDIVRTISVIPNGITRSLYVKECSGLMGIDENTLHAEINKNLSKNKEQVRKREQKSNTPNPTGEPLAVQQPIVSKYEKFEDEIIRLLLTYPDKVLFTINDSDDEEDEQITTINYICREIDNEIEFITPAYMIIFDEVKLGFENNNILDGNYFIHHENQIVAQAAVNLMAEEHTISKMWSKKGTYISTEEDNLKSVIDNAISGYKYELVLSILKDIEYKLKDYTNKSVSEEELKELYDKYMSYTQFKIDISKLLGKRIILKQ